MLRMKLDSGLHCLVGLLVLVTLVGCDLRALFVVFIMKCVDEDATKHKETM